MSIHFDLKAPMSDVDTPILNLRNEHHKFSTVTLLCFDEVIEFTTNAVKHRENLELGKTSIYGESICIEIHKNHLQWIDHGKLNILPFANICRWVLD